MNGARLELCVGSDLSNLFLTVTGLRHVTDETTVCLHILNGEAGLTTTNLTRYKRSPSVHRWLFSSASAVRRNSYSAAAWNMFVSCILDLGHPSVNSKKKKIAHTGVG